MEKNPTLDELRELIRACDDLAGHHVLWVAKNGEVHVSRVPKDKTPVGFQESQADIQLRYETFEAGNDYVGPDAAADNDWINQLFDTLMKEWPRARDKAEVEYIDQL